MDSDTLVFENGTDVAVYTPQTKDGLIIGFHQPDGKFSIVQESAAEIAVRSKSAHYSLSGFEGGKVVVHFTEGGKQRLAAAGQFMFGRAALAEDAEDAA